MLVKQHYAITYNHIGNRVLTLPVIGCKQSVIGGNIFALNSGATETNEFLDILYSFYLLL